MLSELERKQKLPTITSPTRGSAIRPSQCCEVRSQGRQQRASAPARVDMRMRMPGGVRFQPNPEPWQTGTPGWAARLGGLLSSHRTDGETGGQLPHSLWLLLVALSHSAIYITFPSSHQMDSNKGRHPLPTAALKGSLPITSLMLEPAEQPKDLCLPSQHNHTLVGTLARRCPL